MSRPYSDSIHLVRQEIASSAARMIAEDGLDYASAKRKALRQVTGNTRIQGDFLPDNTEIEEEVRIYQHLFQGETQPARLLILRQTALALMRMLSMFRPHLVGAVLNGTAGEHSDIHLQLFTDSAKDVEIHLLNLGITFDAHETPHFRGRGMVETLSFMWASDPGVAPEGVHLNLYESDALRSAPRNEAGTAAERADLAAVEQLLDLTRNTQTQETP